MAWNYLLCFTIGNVFRAQSCIFQYHQAPPGNRIEKNNPQALKVAKLRQDSNFLLTTILWGNVGINVLLTLLSNSVMMGAVAFLFSTFVITFFGEIIPQVYFSRHALKVASLLAFTRAALLSNTAFPGDQTIGYGSR